MAINVLKFKTVCCEGKPQRHVFICRLNPVQLTAAHCVFGKWAENPELPFTWRDASQMVMQANLKCGIDPPLLKAADERCEGR